MGSRREHDGRLAAAFGRLRYALRRAWDYGPGQGLRALVLLVVVAAPLLGGTTEPPYTLIVAGVSGVAGGLAAIVAQRRQELRPLRVSWFAAMIALALFLTLLQCVPLPAGLRALLAPGTDPALRQILGDAELARYPQQAFPLSVDPAAALHEAVRLGGYLCLLLGLGIWGGRAPRPSPRLARRSDSTHLSRGILVAGGLCAGLGALSALGVPLPPPLGVPGTGTTRALLAAGFVNSNHMAALLAVTAILTVGVYRVGTFRGARIGERIGLLALLILCNTALLGTLSRGGIGAGALGQLVVVLLTRRSAPPAGDASDEKMAVSAGARRALGLSGPLLVFASVSMLLALVPNLRSGLLARFASIATEPLSAPGSKLYAWTEALPLLRTHWLLGVGHGGFGAAFQSLNTLSAHTRFPYLENEWLQLALDWGIPGALGLVLLLALGMRDALRRLWRRVHAQDGQRPSVRVAAMVGLGALGLHNLVDFNLAAGGVAIAALVLLCLVEMPRFTLPPRALFGLALATVAGALYVGHAVPDSEQDAAALRALATDPMASATQIAAAGRAALARHPLESDLAATVAARLLQDGPQLEPEAAAAALTWANRALVANPRDVGARHTAALVLASLGHRGQARELIRQALADADPPQRRWLYRVALPLSNSPAELVALLPVSATVADEVLEVLGTAQPPRWEEVRAVAVWAMPLSRERATVWTATAVLAEHDLDGAEQAAAALLKTELPGGPPAFLLGNLLSMLAESGQPARVAVARRLAQEALVRRDPPELWLALALAQLHEGTLSEARESLERALQRLDPRESALRARIHEVRAELEARAGNPHRAETERAEAARLRQPGSE